MLNRLNGESSAPSREEVVIQLTPLADGKCEIGRVVDPLVHRGWLRIDAGHCLHLTDPGEAARVGLRELVTGLRAVAHEGISDEEYVATLKVRVSWSGRDTVGDTTGPSPEGQAAGVSLSEFAFAGARPKMSTAW